MIEIEPIKETNKIYDLCKNLGLARDTYDTTINLLSNISGFTSELPRVFFETEKKQLWIQFGHKLNGLNFSVNNKVVKAKNHSANINVFYDGEIPNDQLKKLLQMTAN